MAAGVSLLTATLPTGTPFWVMVPIVFVFGFAVSGFHGIWMNVATEVVPQEQSGLASGFSVMIGSTGVLFGPPLFGYIVDSTGAFAFGWLFLAVLSIVVTVLIITAMVIVKRSEQTA